MNFIAATVELKSFIQDPINAYGLDYRGADAVVPGGSGNSEVRLRILCYDRAGAKLDAFQGWKPGTRALITGNLVFTEDYTKPLDLIVTTIEPNVPTDMYCNQVVLGNAFFAEDQIKERRNEQVAVKIGTSLDNSDIVTWLYLETHESRKKKLQDRIRKGRALCIQGYLREYRKDDTDSAYRAIVPRLISVLARNRSAVDGTLKRMAQRRVTQTLTRRRTIDRAFHLAGELPGWDAPIYEQNNV